MARITVNLDDELDRKVRTEISKSGGKKGDLAITVQEALRMWLSQREKKTAATK
jgi:Arc/MetJ-type ribon-helix-helix transcriptional regulator